MSGRENPGPNYYHHFGLSKFELMLENRLYRYILGLLIYVTVILIVYSVFKAKKHEHPFIDALKISWIWGIIIVLVLYLWIMYDVYRFEFTNLNFSSI